MFLGEAFWSLLHRWPDPRRRKINAKPWRVVQNQGFTKITKVIFLIQIVSKVCVISGDFGWPFLTWAWLFEENASPRKQPLFYNFLGRFRGWFFWWGGYNPWSNSLPDPPWRQFGSTRGWEMEKRKYKEDRLFHTPYTLLRTGSADLFKYILTYIDIYIYIYIYKIAGLGFFLHFSDILEVWSINKT